MRVSFFSAELLAALPALAAGQTKAEAHATVATPASIKWGAAPAILPPGAKAAVLEGDPSQAGPFALRLWLPAGYTIPPHFHSVPEHVTVVQGVFLVGMGDQLDASRFKRAPHKNKFGKDYEVGEKY